MKSTSFFRTHSFMLLAQKSSAEWTATITFTTINSFIKWLHSTRYPFSPVIVIHVNSGDTLRIDEVSVNLLHNENKSDYHKLQKFQEPWTLFTSDVSIHAIVTYQGVFVLVPAFAGYLGSLVLYIVPSINGDLQPLIQAG